jgi:two-component system chemotaxis response regulator CheB
VVIRRLVTDILSEDPALEVVGTAANGRIALAKIPQVNPDVVTLDVEMPEMNGLEALAEIRKTYPSLPVIMFSNQTARGAEVTIKALGMGATDYVTKPAKVNSLDEGIERIKTELIPKIKAIYSARLAPETGSPEVKPRRVRPAKLERPGRPKPSAGFQRVEVVAIGVSTGGPNALTQVLPKLPADLPVPIVIVQHMPADFTKYLADHLNAKCAIKVSEAQEGDVLKPGHAYIAPGGYHMTLHREKDQVKVSTNQNPPENSCQPAVDVLFRSVAQVYGPKTLAIIMTGMGQDGLNGCENIYFHGGTILVQDKLTSVVWGMPSYVYRANLASKMVSLNKISPEIIEACKKGRLGSFIFK